MKHCIELLGERGYTKLICRKLCVSDVAMATDGPGTILLKCQRLWCQQALCLFAVS